jgi:DNA-binding NarL/FixJ family response regulator
VRRRRVFLADDHAMILDGFKRLLEDEFDLVGTARDGEELLAMFPAAHPDIIVLDIGMPKVDGVEAARRIVGLRPQTKIVFLTVNEDPELAAEALEAVEGSSYLLKKGASAELLLAVREAGEGRPYITPQIARAAFDAARAKGRPKLTFRQLEVLSYLAQGKSMKEAAFAMTVTPRTVAYHKYGMMKTLGIENNAELIRYAQRRGLVD